MDDKIELNRRINETLEEMARALFKPWFVVFDPVRAKQEGRWWRGESLPGLPANFYDLFPNRLVPSELGEIPGGWEVGTVGDAATIVGGSTPSTKVSEYWDGRNYHRATPRDLPSLSMPVLMKTDRKTTDAGLQQIGSGLLFPGTVLMSLRAPIGYLAITEVPVAISQGSIAMQPHENVPSPYLLFFSISSMNEILNHANGSTFLEISKRNFRMIPLLLSDAPLLNAYNVLASSLHRELVANEDTCSRLETLRDILLPRLVAGKNRLPESMTLEGSRE